MSVCPAEPPSPNLLPGVLPMTKRLSPISRAEVYARKAIPDFAAHIRLDKKTKQCVCRRCVARRGFMAGWRARGRA